jgi:hypothetical protein
MLQSELAEQRKSETKKNEVWYNWLQDFLNLGTVKKLEKEKIK